jgi:CheY-like chemotaxis protein
VIELAAHKSLEIVSEFDSTFEEMFVRVDRAMLSKAISYSYRYMCQKCTNFQTLLVRLTCDEILVSPNQEQIAKVRIGICIDLNKKSTTHGMRWWDEKKSKDSLNSNELNMVFVEQIVCAGHNGSITHVKHADLYGIELCIHTTLKPRPQEYTTPVLTPIVGDLSPYALHTKKQSHPVEVDVDIVYIDDSYMLQKGFAFLAKKHGWTSKTFAGGAEAIEWFEHHKSKIILVDKIMPNLDGIETVKRLVHHNIPILGITGDSHDADNQEMIEAGAVRVLIKPVTRKMLTSILGHYFT